MAAYRKSSDVAPDEFKTHERTRIFEIASLIESRLRKEGITSTALYFSYRRGSEERMLVMRERQHVQDNRLQVDIRKISPENQINHPNCTFEATFEVHLGGRMPMTIRDKAEWEERLKAYPSQTRFYGYEVVRADVLINDAVTYLQSGMLVSRVIEALAA